MRLLFLAALAALAASACRDQPAAPPPNQGARPSATVGSAGSAAASATVGSAGSAGSAAAADPWSAAPTPKPPDTPETRRQRAEAALGRVATILPAVAKLRGLAVQRDVPRKYQTTAEFQAFVHREITKELPAERSRDRSVALAQLGLLEKPIELAQVMEQAMITQAGAYYDPAAKAFFLVMVPDSELMLDTISAHELTHALQDQHFELARYLPSDGKIDEDAAIARRFVVEGDATFVMLLYAMHSLTGGEITPVALTGLRKQISMIAAQDVAGLKAQVKGQLGAFGTMDPEIQRSVDAMDDIPATVLVPLVDSYMKGALVALTAYERGGWAGVDALYRTPPESTEQVLHPATKLYPRPERPHRITLARSAGRELWGDVLGELQWKIYFELWKAPHGAEAAEGWGGDRISVTRRADGRVIARIATSWDTPGDAEQFLAAYLASLAARFPGADPSQPDAGVARPEGGKIFARRVGSRVFILDGADDRGALEAMIRTTRVH